MSKILQVAAERRDKPGRTHYEYPDEYDAQKIQVLCYENPEDHEKRNDGKQYLIGVVSDEDADQFLESDSIEELSKEEALEKGDRWTSQVEKIVDERKVIKLAAKQARGEELSQKEKDVLHPEKDERGINMSKSFEEQLNEQLE